MHRSHRLIHKFPPAKSLRFSPSSLLITATSIRSLSRESQVPSPKRQLSSLHSPPTIFPRPISIRTMSTSAEALDMLPELYQAGELEAPSSASRTHDSNINSKVTIHRGDITKLKCGAIVNAANKSLLGGGGVDGAIHRAAGPALLKECRALNGCETGQSKATRAYNLPCDYVIHTVGPIYNMIDDPRESAALLKSCYQTCMELAAEICEEDKSIAFNCIGTGIYGYPKDEAAKIACETVRDFLETEEGQKLDKVIFVLFDGGDVDAYGETLPKIFPPGA